MTVVVPSFVGRLLELVLAWCQSVIVEHHILFIVTPGSLGVGARLNLVEGGTRCDRCSQWQYSSGLINMSSLK